MARRPFRLGTALSLGGIVAAGPLIAACGGPSYEDWAATDGAAGRINLDDVQQAFKDSDSATEFEKRVNEIYEGDGIVLIRAKQDGQVLTLEGWEDLNNDNEINEANDDQLFAIVRDTNGDHQMRGYHSNGYYNSHWGPGDFLFTYLLISAVTPRFGGYYYSTSAHTRHGYPQPAVHLPQLLGLRQTDSAQRQLQPEAVVLRRVAVPVFAGQCQLQPQLLPVDPEDQRQLPHQQLRLPKQLRAFVVAQFRRLRWRGRHAGSAEGVGIGGSDGRFLLQASLEGMKREDCLTVELPSNLLDVSLSQLLDGVFPVDDETRQEITGRFDLRANPDLPEIYSVFLAVCEEWRDWRCALQVTAGDGEVALDEPTSSMIKPIDDMLRLSLHLEQRYCPLEYAVRHGLWESRDGLLDWMRSLAALYFIDKHEVEVEVGDGDDQTSGLALERAIETLQEQGLIGPSEGSEDDYGEEDAAPPPRLVITPDGRRFIAGLLDETESYIDQYDHYQDILDDPDGEMAEFGSGRGVDLRVQAFLADELDPVRTVFLLRLYDGTLDARLRDWETVMESDEFFEAVLEPVVNRDNVTPEEMERVMDFGHAWLDERQEQERRETADRDLLRRAGGEVP